MIQKDKTEERIIFIDDAHVLGGTQIALGWSIRALLGNSQAEIVCVCPAKTRAVIERIVGNNPRLEFVECPSALPLNLFAYPLRLLPFFRIISSLRRRPVRSWWLNLAGIEFCLAPLLVLRTFGETPRAYLHNTQTFLFFNRKAQWPRRALSLLRDLLADRLLFRLYPLVVAPSQSSEAEIIARIRNDSRPATGYLYYPPIGKDTEESILPVAPVRSDGPIDLWMIGHVNFGHKNNLVALDVLQELTKLGRTVTLTIVGDGPDSDTFKCVAKRLGIDSKIDYRGWLQAPWESVPRNALVFIPSLFETMNLVAREAMKRGIRLAASPIPVFREWIPGPLLARNFSIPAFVEKIVEVEAMSSSELSTLYLGALARFSNEIFVKGFQRYSDSM